MMHKIQDIITVSIICKQASADNKSRYDHFNFMKPFTVYYCTYIDIVSKQAVIDNNVIVLNSCCIERKIVR